jgi:hypothetical protein
MFSAPPGSFEICEICGWEDDPVQLLDPKYEGGANTLSLIEAQNNFQEFGAYEPDALFLRREPSEEDTRDPEWRPATEADCEGARTPASLSTLEYESLDIWYYWRRNSAL